MVMELKNRIVVITGAGRGIGKALAIGFCQDKANVVGFSRTEQDLIETSQLCNGNMHYVVGDVTEENDVQRLFIQTINKYGRVDILINNAAVNPKRKLFLDMSYSKWVEVININLMGVALCCKTVLPYMLEQGYGRIINISSFTAGSKTPSSGYAVSKAALSVFTKALAREVREKSDGDILINDLIPGSIKTAMNSTGREDPITVYPHARFIASLPKDGPTGKVFFNSKICDINNDPRKKKFFNKLKSKV